MTDPPDAIDVSARPRSRRRWVRGLLIVLAVQFLALVAGGAVAFRASSEQVAEGLENLIHANNQEIADSLSELIGAVDDRVEYGGAEWDRMQRVIEGFGFVGDGFACVIDENGLILAHPDIRAEPSLREVNLGAEVLRTTAGEATPIGEAGTWVTVGNVDFGPDGTHYVAAKRLGDSPLRLVVHQPINGLAAARRHVFGGLGWTTLAIGAVVVALTAALTLPLLRRHDALLTRWNHKLEDEVARRTDQLEHSRAAVLVALAELAERRDNETGRHVKRISLYAVILAEAMRETHPEVTDAWLERLRVAASLHDVGKVAVSDTILHKPAGLTPAEFDAIKRHAAAGADALIAVRQSLVDDDLLDMAVEVALYHHEKFDGSGYPTGLAGDAIPLSARVVAVADVFDALLSPRVYKPAMPIEQAREVIVEGAGKHFDPAVVEAYRRTEAELLAVRKAHDDPAVAA